MPLSEPSGGIGRKRLLVRNTVFGDGADGAINFIGADYDSFNDQWLVGGNNSFVGFQQINRNKVAQSAALPSTVITAGNIADIAFSNIDNGVLVRIGNEYARSSDGGATWVDITPAAVVTYRGVLSWKGTQLLCGAASGTEDIFISTDNGATYPNTRDIFSAAVEFFTKDSLDTTFLLGALNDRVAITQDEDIGTATFITHDLSATIGFSGNVDTGAIAPGGKEIVVAGDGGDIAVSTDSGVTFTLFPRDDNPFRNANGVAHEDIEFIEYVPAFSGFMVGGISVFGFIPGNTDLLSMQPVHVAAPSNPSYTTSRNSYSATDGTNLVVMTNLNFQFGTVAP